MGLLNKQIRLLVALLIALREATIVNSSREQANHKDFDIHVRKTHVSVLNQLNKDFTVYCKLKKEDLGTHVIFGQKYDMVFRVNFWDTTLFFCTITSQLGSISWDLYGADRDLNGNEFQCHWVSNKRWTGRSCTTHKCKRYLL
ncbi:Self-incomp_S1 domain-containing protein [Cephalotus follicularis]|uniref:S-protein homolog n=1 Tax=Cephalotus follicularis TaxID=3775 RepID=A0A1Q3BIH2_CEPFO|nr:Self-incomp_S1 domain-containing protein [Cephalotus follicularis]